MGICLDTEQNGSQIFEDGDRRRTGRWQGEAGLLSTPPDGNFPMQNIGPVKFESPKVPVIFVLGGPGSGKVTHCDNLMHEKKGITHINMTDLLQQYAMGNDMLDFGLLSSKTVTEVLMLEIKMSPSAKTFLVSGYPRNMRDVVEYSEKIQIVNGVVLVSWRQEILERQIDYGAQLGHVILGLARMELHNFYRNVMPVAEYFDQSGMLVAVNGERNPSEVYVDFREAVMKILGMSEGDENRRGNPPGSVEAEVKVERRSTPEISPRNAKTELPIPPHTTSSPNNIKPSKTAERPRKGLPYFIWVIGGPGSNKSALSSRAIEDETGWVHVSVGSILRGMASTNSTVREALLAGEMAPHDVVSQIIEKQILLNRDNDGIVIDGYPRDSEQVEQFEKKFGQEPPLLLLDCSKLQLGRGRIDDSVSAFRKRLEMFRELSLPMLKQLDDEKRLTIVDGDTDSKIVQEEFVGALKRLIKNATTNARNNEDKITNELLISKNVYEKTDTITNGKNVVGNNRNKTVPKSGSFPSPSSSTLSPLFENKKSNILMETLKKVEKNGFNNNGNVNKKLSNGFKTVGKNGPGINSISRKVQERFENGVTTMIAGAENGLPKVGNGVSSLHDVDRSKKSNGVGTSIVDNRNGATVGNGIGSLVNGHLPVNKVAPVAKNRVEKNGKRSLNPVRNMYNEVEGYQNDTHI